MLNTIQALLDDFPKLKFYLSGSSARKLKKGRANLLPGRLFTYQMNPLSLLEIGSDWNEKLALQYGFLPGGYLDFSKLAKKTKIPRQSVVRHFEILEDTLIAKKIENDPDIDPDSCDLVKHPRYFFFDIGVVNALRGGFEVSQDRIGPMWEYLIFNQITNSSVALDYDTSLYNFRTRGGLEVDFIYSFEGKKTAIECKSSLQVDSSDYQNLLAVEKYYPKIQKLVIYRGTKERKENGIWIVPLKKSLDILGLKPF